MIVKFNKAISTLFLLAALLSMGNTKVEAQDQAAIVTCATCNKTGLVKGINLFDWFMGPNIYAPGHSENYITAEKVQALKNLGFQHVRLPVYPKFIADVNTNPAVFNSRITYLDNALRLLHSQKMRVVLVLFSVDDTRRLATSEEAQASYASLWKALAKRYQNFPPDSLYFELLNEPHFQAYMSENDARARWDKVQQQFLTAIRSITTQHYIIATSHDWDTVGSVSAIKTTVADPKIIYTAHFYEPIAFTHQGISSFGDPMIRRAYGLPYPVEEQSCLTHLATLPSDVAQSLKYYCYGKYNHQWIDTKFRTFTTWANTHKVPIYIGEFGTTLQASPPGAPQRWLTDVRQTAVKYGIPWSYWAYNEAPFISINDAAQGNFNPTVLKGLGLP